MIKNLKVSTKLLLGFGAIILISAIMMLASLSSIQDIGKQTDALYRDPFTVTAGSIRIQKNIQDIGREMYDIYLFGNMEDSGRLKESRDEIMRDLDLVNARFTGDWGPVEELSAEVGK